MFPMTYFNSAPLSYFVSYHFFSLHFLIKNVTLFDILPLDHSWEDCTSITFVFVAELFGNCFRPQRISEVIWARWFNFLSREIQNSNDDNNNNYTSPGRVLKQPLSFISLKLVLAGRGKSQPPTQEYCIHIRNSSPFALLSSLTSLYENYQDWLPNNHKNCTNSSLVYILSGIFYVVPNLNLAYNFKRYDICTYIAYIP